MKNPPFLSCVLTALVWFTCAGLARAQLPNFRLWGPIGAPAADAIRVEILHDLPYFSGPKADKGRHRLDLYLPKGKKDFPVLVLVHGGAWSMGDNRCMGLYTTVGEFLASRGIGVAMPNYRLSPAVQHPEHVKDVAQAVAWTHANIAKHAGNPDHLFLAGHSAGGHLVALLATDGSYLQAAGLKGGAIKGVVAISGVYRIPEGDLKVKLGGQGGESFNPDQMMPFRGDTGKVELSKSIALSLPFTVNVYGTAFGNDPKVRTAASPIAHVREGLPPFLVLCAEKDLPTLAGMAEEFHRVLADQGGTADFVRVRQRNHNSIMFSAATVDDPVARAVVEFINKNKK
jgi:acetyl esterase/lipase